MKITDYLKNRLEQQLTRAWYSHFWWPKLFIPLAWLFSVLVSLRRFLYRNRLLAIKYFPVPVIIVGNITVGGTGKTPLIIWLANFLKQYDFNPGIISRGYGGNYKQAVCLVTATSSPAEVGEEPLLIVQQTGCPVYVSHSRLLAVEALLANNQCNIVLSDDGLQYYALGRTLEIAVIDGKRRFGNGHALPAGPLRESVQRLQEVDFVICNGGKPLPNEYIMILQPGLLHNLAQPDLTSPLAAFSGQIIHAVAGIGHPQRFFQLLKQQGLEVIEHIFPDHYHFQASDVDFDDGVIIMTEKDALKCSSFAKNNHWYLPIHAKLDHNFSEKLLLSLK